VDFVARIKATVHLKLLAGFFIGALLLLGMGILSVVAINRMNQQVEDLNDLSEKVDRSRQAIFLITAQSHYRGMALVCELVQLPSTDSPNDCTGDPPWNDRIASAKAAFGEQLEALDRISPPEQDERFGRLREANDRFAASSETALALHEAGEIGEAVNVHMLQEHEVSHELEADLKGLIDDSSREMAEATAAFKSDREVLTAAVATFSGVSLVTALFLGLVLSLAFVRPVRRIDHVLARIARGDFTQRVQVLNRDEFGTLSRNLNDTSERLASLYGDLQKKVDEQVEELKREALQRERIEQELRVAHDIQLAFLPKQLPHLPGWQVEAHYQPARAVGGDFYDFIDLPDGRLGIVVGDVSDKGVPAALVMCATRSMLRGAAQRLDSPGEVLAVVNELLYRDIPANMFVTCLYAILDTESGRLVYANAGHNLPYLRTDGGVAELRATGMPLGCMPGMTYEEKSVTLAPGGSVLFHSDGLVEAHDTDRQMFGFPRLMGLVERHPGGAPLIDLLVAELARFTGANWEQEDDVTLVTLQRATTVSTATTASGVEP
jgi:serine phosphatase RsbU (regulator of sigma subunit)/CHASE3 domain sensor protein